MGAHNLVRNEKQGDQNFCNCGKRKNVEELGELGGGLTVEDCGQTWTDQEGERQLEVEQDRMRETERETRLNPSYDQIDGWEMEMDMKDRKKIVRK